MAGVELPAIALVGGLMGSHTTSHWLLPFIYRAVSYITRGLVLYDSIVLMFCWFPDNGGQRYIASVFISGGWCCVV